MKNVFLTVFMSACALVAPAQQAIWGTMPLKSPEINADKSVTFRFASPGVESVEVTGDFLPTKKVSTPYGEYDAPGTASLTQNAAGVWEYTTSSPLSPELYSYTFIVDGVRMTDPCNVHQLRDVTTISNIFIVPGEGADQYCVNDVPHGTVAKVWYDSPMLELHRRLTVYTPAGYETSSQHYPVLYLLHGMGGDENAWTELGRVAQILDNLIAQGLAEPMIVVMTNGNASQEAAPGETSEGLKQPTTQLPKSMDGSFEQAFPEVVAFVDKAYRTKPEKASRAIAGLSMGGFHSMQISKEYPDMFDYVGLFSAAVFRGESTKSPVYENFEEKLDSQFAASPKLYWIGIGEKDFLYEDNVKLRQMLDSKKYPYTYFESADGHIWKNWRIYLSRFLPLIFK